MCGCWLAPADQPLVSPSASTACVLGTLVSLLVKHLPGSRRMACNQHLQQLHLSVCWPVVVGDNERWKGSIYCHQQMLHSSMLFRPCQLPSLTCASA